MKKLIFALSLIPFAFGQPNLKYPPLRQIELPKIDTVTLPNGMQLLLLENHELPTIRGVALVRTGNLFDPADKIGLASITGETLRSGGTTGQTGDQLDEQLENIAASVEANIGEGSGTVHFSALKESTDEVLGVFRDVLTSPGFREDKIELVKTQMRSGLSRRNDDASGIAGREFASLIYGKNNSYGWDMTYATIDSIGRADVDAFYSRYFFPANVVMAVTGDFDSSVMRTKIAALFAGWTVRQAKVPPFPPVTYVPVPGTYLAVKTDVTQTNFLIGLPGGRLDDKDYPALEVMGDILGGGFRSRLFQTVRTKLGYAYNISADWGASFDHPGMFEISGSTKSGSTTEAIQVAEKELEKMRTAEVTKEELETAKQAVLNGFVFNFDTPTKTLDRLLIYKYYGYPDDFLFRYQKAVAAVTRADVLRVAKENLDPKKLLVLAVGNPKDFGQPLTALGTPVKELDIALPEPKVAAPVPGNVQDGAGSREAGVMLLKQVQQASGGAEKLASVRDFSQRRTMAVAADAGGLKAEQWNRWIAPGAFRQDAHYPFGDVKVYVNGAEGWIVTPQGTGPIPEAQRKQVEGELFQLYIPLLLSDRDPGRRINLAAPGTIEITSAKGDKVKVTIDSKTNLPVRAENGPIAQEFSSFVTVDGILLPSKITILQAGKKFADVTVTENKINAGVTVETLAKKP